MEYPSLMFCGAYHAPDYVKKVLVGFIKWRPNENNLPGYLSDQEVLRGKKVIIAGWNLYFADTAAPFFWISGEVEVLEPGLLTHSSGPVFAADGKQIGTFNSIWRRENKGSWKVVFDKGCPHCPQ